MENNDRYLVPAPLVTLDAPGVPPDVELFGVPFDATSTFRAGSRFAPDAIRAAFWNIEVYSRPLDVDLEELSLADRGNVRHTASVAAMAEAAERTARETLGRGRVPAGLGGEHSVTYGLFGAMPPETALLVFDAHFDLRDSYDDLSLMHATYLRRLLEQRPGLTVIHVGARAATREEWRVAGESGLSLVTAQHVLSGGDAPEMLRSALAAVESVYVSLDLDVLDPAYAPGVANPEPCGLSTWQLVRCLHLLRDTPIRGFDIVELSPAYDSGGITAVAAAKCLAELCCLVHLNRHGG